ncbi:MAG: aldo/keto reductase [Cytophagales bacterium]|nr:aldo/keto reductase [Armatimonadota bacterium]
MESATPVTKLGLGGHSFIRELGNDPPAAFEEQCALVAACLDTGIRWIDTTYYQERVALGRVLGQLSRARGEARLTAWNFFREPGRENSLPGFTAYDQDSLPKQLAELRTDFLDLLVIHTRDDSAALHREIELASAWQAAGLVREVGLGMARLEDLDCLPTGHPITQVLAPYNAFHPHAAALFREAKARGMATVAMSPFVRGWNLDKIGGDRRVSAAILLRWVTSQEIVDTVFVSMRRAEWVLANRESEKRGPLSNEETALVREWTARLEG